jgi:hypothetical protein
MSTVSMVRRRDASSAAGLPGKRLQYSSTVIETNFPSRRPSMCAVGRKALRMWDASPVAWPCR